MVVATLEDCTLMQVQHLRTSMLTPCRKYQHVLCKLCYVDSDSTTELRKTILKSVLVAKDSLVYSGGQQPGEKANSYPRNNSKDSALP